MLKRYRPTVRTHDLRHTYALHLASSGISLQIIGKLIGHTQASTTQRYAHRHDDSLREATNRFGRLSAHRNAAKRVDNGRCEEEHSLASGAKPPASSSLLTWSTLLGARHIAMPTSLRTLLNRWENNWLHCRLNFAALSITMRAMSMARQ